MSEQCDTVFALATAPGRAGIAVVRVSGPAARDALAALAPSLKTPPAPRVATRAMLSAPPASSATDRDTIDDGLVLWFRAPASFTGEDVVEFHVHGGHAVIDALLTSLSGLPGLRPAEPGEFTRRAFEHGKMDLTAAEAVADLVDAETAEQRRQALLQMGGALGALYDGWRARLVKSMAFTEATIDFAEEDIPDDLVRQSLAEVAAVRDEIEAHLDDRGIGERIRAGLRIALTGAPNVGKSSLLNTLAARDVAIVSEIAGTTRDVIEVPMDLGGYAVTLIDTAGLRDTGDAVEREGVRRAMDEAAAADIRLHLIEAEACGEVTASSDPGVDDPRALVVVNKIDLWRGGAPGNGGIADAYISVATGEGIGTLIDVLTERVRTSTTTRARDEAPLTRVRHRRALETCAQSLAQVERGAADGLDIELIAEDLRYAAQALGRITGRVDVEELLDRIFGDFCIGK